MFTLSSVSKSYSRVFITGMALIFSLQLNAALTQGLKLTADDASQLANFGTSVSISGDYAVVGAPNAILTGSTDRFGAAYVFKFNGAAWAQTHQLISSDPVVGELFGKSVSISGTSIIVGSPNATVNGNVKAGVVYVYELDGLGDWIESVRLTTLDNNSYDFFGHSVKLDGDRFIAGATGNDDGASSAGTAYIFDYDSINSSWSESVKLISFQPGSLDYFGSKVDIQGDRAIVSAPNRNALVGSFDYSDVGMVAVFDKNGNNWDSTTMLFAPDLNAADFFGIDISLSGDRILVGSYKDDDGGAESGSAYIFDYDTNTSSWNSGTKITAPDAVAYDHFGTSVALDGATAYIGSPENDDNSESSSGSVYVYTYDGSSWAYQNILLHTDTPRNSDAFGNSIAVDASNVFIGSYRDDADQGGNFNSGAAYVFAVNLDPTATNDAFPINEDINGVNFNPSDNDNDPEGDAITITSITQPVNGLAYVFLNDTHIRYEPNDDYCNDGTPTEDFTYTINGGSTATISITVNCIDDLPIAIDDTSTINEDLNVLYIRVLDNDTDVDGGPKVVDSFTQAAHGTVGTFGPSLSYSPDSNYCNDGNTTDDFTYTLNGGSQATVSITVDCVDDSPEAVVDSATLDEDSNATALNVLNNDTDIDGGSKTIISISQPSNGTVVNNASDVSYTPDANYCNDGNTTDDFTYTLNGDSQTTVSVTVTCVNDAPVAVSDSQTFNEDDNATIIDVLDNDTDVESDAISILSISQPSNGTVINNNSNVTYTPNQDYCNDGTSTDDFSYTINDGSSTTVSVSVNCVNDAPSFTITGDIDASDLLSNTTQLIIPNFANNYVFGPSNESSQQISQFNISEASDSSNVVSNISINNAGDLTIDLTLNSGLAIIQLSLQDNGGTDYSGDDTSGLIQFNVFFSDVIFAGGFEAPVALKVDDYLFNLASKHALFELPVYDNFSESVLYYEFMLELNLTNTNRYVQHKIEQWLSEVNKLKNN